MINVLGSNFAETRLVKRCLETFKGIGPVISQRVMARLYIHPTCRIGEMADKQVLSLTTELSSMTIDNELRRQLHENIRRLRDMGSYRGRRHATGLPVRGQNTRSQARTARRLNRVERFG